MTQQEYLAEFTKITNAMCDLTAKKNADYADSQDAFANFRLCEELGVCTTEAGILTRMTDKLQRVANLLKRDGQVADEKIEDTLLDNAVYSIILTIYLRYEKQQRTVETSTNIPL